MKHSISVVESTSPAHQPVSAMLALALALPVLPALAATDSVAGPGSQAPITRVTVYPGVASVERTARVAAGARQLSLDCLPASIDQQSLQVSADAGVRIGDIKILLQPRELTGKACASPLEQQIRSLEDQLAALNADETAAKLVGDYLQGVAKPTDGKDNASPAASQIGATSNALRSASRDNSLRAHQTLRQKEALQEQLKPLLQERDRTANARSQVMKVTVQLATANEATVQLNYQVRGPSWQPVYRAQLDSAKSTIQLERQALVAQNSGEDWSNVQLLLSTGQPTRSTQGALPRPWTLDIERPRPVAAPAPVAAAAPMMMERARSKMAEAADAQSGLPTFDVSTIDTAYATQFAVPYKISVPSSSERVTLSLGSQVLPATLLTRTAPAVEEAAYLVAQLMPPAGIWPAGTAVLMRDGAFVGQGRLDFGDTTALARGLSFGRDERVSVRKLPPEEHAGSAGFISSSTERQVSRRFEVQNRHDRSIRLEVVDAAPVAKNDRISVQSQYQPQPATLRWNEQPGLIAWRQELAAGGSARFEARHQIRFPQDAQIDEQQ